MTCSQSSSVIFHNTVSRKIPALLTMTSIRPVASTAVLTARSTSSVFETSARDSRRPDLGSGRLNQVAVEIDEKRRGACVLEEAAYFESDSLSCTCHDDGSSGEVVADIWHGEFSSPRWVSELDGLPTALTLLLT